ncbi:MAG TPA: hypothetical protein VJN70_09105 [Gemmatimonadaceae bacterium]|nr:hypothetical protein [Gemmatimonadaceae bacterium]
MTEPYEGQPFLNTLRAVSVSAREFARLGDCLSDGVQSSFGETIDRKPNVRRSPDRCIIQVGPCAVTVAWIRNRHDAAEGELLIIHWRGTVAPATQSQFERARELTLTATPLSESVFVADATSETDWMWRSREEPLLRYSSASLATWVIERLRIVRDEIGSEAS